MADREDMAIAELALKMGFLTAARMDECLRLLEAAPKKGRRIGDVMLEKKYITAEQLAQLVARVKAQDPAVRRRRDAEAFAKFALQRGMISKEQAQAALKLFEYVTDPDRTMAQVMIENGLLSEEQVTEITMNQRTITMRCPNCRLKFAIVTVTERTEVPCPKCGKLLEPAGPETVKVVTSPAPTPPSPSPAAAAIPAQPPAVKKPTTQTQPAATPSAVPSPKEKPQIYTQVFRAVKPVAQPAPAGPKRKVNTKCVVCDQAFEGELDADRRVTCPACGTSFTVL